MRARLSLGALCQVEGRLDEARAHYEASLDDARARDRGNLHIWLGNLALLHHSRGEYAKAAAHAAEACASARETHNREGVCDSLTTAGLIEAARGRTESAEDLLKQALALADEMRDVRQRELILTNLAAVSIRKGELGEARSAFEEALELARATGERPREGSILAGMATIELEEGHVERAESGVKEALDSCGERRNPRFEGYSLCLWADIRRLHGDMAEALRDVIRSETILDGCGQRVELALCLCVRGRIELAAGTDARETLDRARVLLQGMEADAESHVGREVGLLGRAVEARESGDPLLCGALPESVPAPLKRWIARRSSPEPDGL